MNRPYKAYKKTEEETTDSAAYKAGFVGYGRDTHSTHVTLANNTDYNMVMGIDDASSQNVSIWVNSNGVNSQSTTNAVGDLNLDNSKGFHYGVMLDNNTKY